MNQRSPAAMLLAIPCLVGMVAEHADASVAFTFHMTVSGAGAGYQLGDSVSYTFILQSTVAPGTQSTFAGTTETSWSSGQIWDAIEGTGLSGAWGVPASPSESLEVRSNGNLSINVYDRTDAFVYGAGSSYLEIFARFDVPGNALSWDPSLLDANAYFAGRVGNYAPSTSDCYAYTAIDSANLTVNTLEISIVPAPGAVALIGLGGLTARRRRS